MKKVLLIIICVILFFGIWQTAQGVDLLLKYPTIKQQTPTTGGLPGLIKYIYLFALGACGIVALIAMLIGAIMYVFSAGNPSKASDAKDRIFSAILGIIILLASVLILEIINPDLVNIGFTLPEIKNGGNGGNDYLWTQCHVRNAPIEKYWCPQRQHYYVECNNYYGNKSLAKSICIEECNSKVAIHTGGGVVYCDVYNDSSQCKSMGCHKPPYIYGD